MIPHQPSRPLCPASEDLVGRLLQHAADQLSAEELAQHEDGLRKLLGLIDNLDACDLGELLQVHATVGALVEGLQRVASPEDLHALLGRLLEGLAAIDEPARPSVN